MALASGAPGTIRTRGRCPITARPAWRRWPRRSALTAKPSTSRRRSFPPSSARSTRTPGGGRRSSSSCARTIRCTAAGCGRHERRDPHPVHALLGVLLAADRDDRGRLPRAGRLRAQALDRAAGQVRDRGRRRGQRRCLPVGALAGLRPARKGSGAAARFTRAYRQARAWLLATPPSQVAEAEASFFPEVDRAVLTRTIATYQQLGCWTPHVEITRPAFEVTLDVFQHAGLITRRHRYEDVVAQPPGA